MPSLKSSPKFKMSASYSFKTLKISNDQKKKQRKIPKESIKQKSLSFETIKKRSGKRSKKSVGWLVRTWMLNLNASDQDLDEGNYQYLISILAGIFPLEIPLKCLKSRKFIHIVSGKEAVKKRLIFPLKYPIFAIFFVKKFLLTINISFLPFLACF